MIQVLVMYLVLGTAALCVTAIVSTVALAVTDGRGGVAPWVRRGLEVGEPASVRR